LINGKRNQRRQPKKWKDNVIEDMKAKKLNVQQAVVLVWDKQMETSSSLIIVEMMKESRRRR